MYAPTTFSQTLELDNKKAKELKRLAEDAQDKGDFYVALEIYKKIVMLDTANVEMQYKLAELLRYSRNYALAEKHYATVYKLNPTQYPLALFYLATMQKANNKYSEAKKNLEKFKKDIKKVEDPKYKKLVESEIQGCTLAIALKDSTNKASMASIGNKVNSTHIDFSPIPTSDDSLIFGSLRDTEQEFYKISEDDTLKLPKRKFYNSVKNKNEWELKGELSGPFNTKDADIANGTFSLDKKRFYFTKCEQNWKGKISCKMYSSEKNDTGWTAPEPLNNQINVDGYTTTHPTVGRESKKKNEVIYFVSDRDGGKGGLDIWYVEYDTKKKSYKEPKNAGNSINTPGNEVTPYYDAKSKTLYYSTDGKPNMGGLDIYSAVGELNKFGTSKHLGIPYNTSADDLDFALKPSGKGGFFVSNRIGGLSIYNPTCCDDIYEFSYLNFIEVGLIGKILDVNQKCIDTTGEINVYILNENNDKFLTESIAQKGCNYSLKLKPGVDYEIEIKKDGHFISTTQISTKAMVKSGTLTTNITAEKLPESPIIIPKINYDFNSDKLTQDSKNTLDTSLVKLLKNNPTLKVEIGAHTDNKGSDAYNLKLSQSRAQSVVNYLASKGIANIRLKAMGYGETKPIAPNSNPDGTDNPDGRTKNRRTEFKIIGNIDPDLIKYEDD